MRSQGGGRNYLCSGSIRRSYESMPRNAIAEGCVDFVLPPSGIAQELGRIAKHFSMAHAVRERESPTGVRRPLPNSLNPTPAEHDRFVSHLYRSRREYRSACERAGKSGKQIERD